MVKKLKSFFSKSKPKPQQNWYWDKVVSEGRNYALMKTMGMYLDDKGCLVSVSFSDREMYAEQFETSMKRYAVNALAEDACRGVE